MTRSAIRPLVVALLTAGVAASVPGYAQADKRVSVHDSRPLAEAHAALVMQARSLVTYEERASWRPERDRQTRADAAARVDRSKGHVEPSMYVPRDPGPAPGHPRRCLRSEFQSPRIEVPTSGRAPQARLDRQRQPPCTDSAKPACTDRGHLALTRYTPPE